MKIIKNKSCNWVLLLFFSFLTVPVRGQKALDETIQKNVLLEKEIELLEKDSAKLNDSIKDILLLIEKDSLKNKDLNTRYNALMSSSSQDSISALAKQVDSLEKQHKALQTAILSIKKDISEKDAELREADSELRNMNVYSEIQNQQAYKSNKLYLNQRYSLISKEKLEEFLNNMDEFKSFEDFTDYQKRVSAALNNKKIYDDASECVNTGVNYQIVDDLRSGIQTLLEIKKDDYNKGVYKLSKEQFIELDSLDIKLSRYNNGIRELQNIVSKVNADEEIIQIRNARRSGLKRDCIALMKEYVVPEEGSEEARIFERYFKMIPYLEKLLRKYWNELKANPFETPTKTEKIITELLVK